MTMKPNLRQKRPDDDGIRDYAGPLYELLACFHDGGARLAYFALDGLLKHEDVGAMIESGFAPQAAERPRIFWTAGSAADKFAGNN